MWKMYSNQIIIFWFVINWLYSFKRLGYFFYLNFDSKIVSPYFYWFQFTLYSSSKPGTTLRCALLQCNNPPRSIVRMLTKLISNPKPTKTYSSVLNFPLVVLDPLKVVLSIVGTLVLLNIAVGSLAEINTVILAPIVVWVPWLIRSPEAFAIKRTILICLFCKRCKVFVDNLLIKLELNRH